MMINKSPAQMAATLLTAQSRASNVKVKDVVKIVEEIIEQDTVLGFEGSVGFWEEVKNELKK